MFDIGFQEMLLIGVIALLVFGPTKLPELGRMFGRALREFRRASDEFRSTVETNLHLHETEPLIPPTTIEESVQAAPVAEPAPDGTALSPVAYPAAVGTAVAPPAEPYCARRGSRLLHRSDCVWVARIPEDDRVLFKLLAEGREQGFVNCPVCEPWEPA